MKCYFCGKRIVASKNRNSLFPYASSSIDEDTCCSECYKKEVLPTLKAIRNLSEGKANMVAFYKNGKVREEEIGIFTFLRNPEKINADILPNYEVLYNANAQKNLDTENVGVKSVFGLTILGNVVFRRK